ncbi:putative enoyl-[acyl-carrier-protein] reductase II [Clostridium sp. N3C]|uniref:NAD(P)H-dependent flavin oxidoreductase n=1 Tax=Clostridium sp. N3C TaxID=1776758 RepID=UPI00092E0D10|nr:nitronate monooxygenase family protein [Clostridium sp. N3C]SCN25945.1 putative enoyl-[acyl-carrier-protein] reductase II [Clostridium sp. N3C]
MNFRPLKIGNLIASLPIIQGGMGIGVSLSGLASAVAVNGGIGVISAAQPGFNEPDFENNPLVANLRALKKHIKEALIKAKGGIIGVNIMCAMNNYEALVKTSIEAGAQLIISGAGLPTTLPKLCQGTNVKIAPIVSSNKAASLILKLWDRNYSVTADAVIVEGPKAGGHLGFKIDDLEKYSQSGFDKELIDIINTVKIYEEKYNKSIPVIAAGGIYTGSDIGELLKLGANGVQISTRFVTTDECDAHINFKKAYINCTKDDIVIVKSPVGMPGRAIKNKFVERTFLGNIKVNKCYKCISKCNPAVTPYCISRALINAVQGDIDNGLIFCGSNAYRTDKIISVKELMRELVTELKAY